MQYELNEEKTYTAYFDRFLIDLPGEAINDMSHQGDCYEDAKHWSKIIPNNLDPNDIIEELASTGGWEREKLDDPEENYIKILWVASCNIKDFENEE